MTATVTDKSGKPVSDASSRANLDVTSIYNRKMAVIKAAGSRCMAARLSSTLILFGDRNANGLRVSAADVLAVRTIAAVRASLLKLGWGEDDWNIVTIDEGLEDGALIGLIEEIDPRFVVTVDQLSTARFMDISRCVFSIYDEESTSDDVRVVSSDGRLSILLPKFDSMFDDPRAKQRAWRALKLLVP